MPASPLTIGTFFLQAADSPAVKLTGHPESFYTLAMVDIDAPGGQGAADNTNYLHWLVVNIPGARCSSMPACFVAPAPPSFAEHHRTRLLSSTALNSSFNNCNKTDVMIRRSYHLWIVCVAALDRGAGVDCCLT